MKHFQSRIRCFDLKWCILKSIWSVFKYPIPQLEIGFGMMRELLNQLYHLVRYISIAHSFLNNFFKKIVSIAKLSGSFKIVTCESENNRQMIFLLKSFPI